MVSNLKIVRRPRKYVALPGCISSSSSGNGQWRASEIKSSMKKENYNTEAASIISRIICWNRNQNYRENHGDPKSLKVKSMKLELFEIKCASNNGQHHFALFGSIDWSGHRENWPKHEEIRKIRKHVCLADETASWVNSKKKSLIS